MFPASTCPSSGGNYCIYATPVFVTLYGWRLVYWLDWVSIQPADHTPLVQSDKHQCRIDTVISSWWWTHGCPKHAEKLFKYIKKNCAPSWTYLQDYTGMQGQQNIKFGIVCCWWLIVFIWRNEAIVCCIQVSRTCNIQVLYCCIQVSLYSGSGVILLYTGVTIFRFRCYIVVYRCHYIQVSYIMYGLTYM